MIWTGVPESQHRLDFLHPNTGKIPELLLDERSGPLDLGRVLIARLGRHPIDVALERIDVRRGVCPEVDVVCMFVHVESQDRDAARRGLAMIARILIDEPAIAGNIDEQDPSGAACQALRHSDELTAPTVHRSEVAGECLAEHLGRLSITESHAREVQLVEKC